MSDITRKLATVRVISGLRPIPGADFIECATIDGWEVIVKKGDFLVADRCIYFEIDSFLPITPEFEFLRKQCYKATPHLGEGFRLRTIKMKKQISQGLALPLSDFPHIDFTSKAGTDLTEALLVRKWELPDFNVNKPMSGARSRGSFPRFIRKTDQERVQNFIGHLSQLHSETIFEVTLKLDGSSMTVYLNNGVEGVCSRNIDLIERDREPWLQRFRNLGELIRLPASTLDRWEEKLDLLKCRIFGGRPGLVKQQSVFWHVAREQKLHSILREYPKRNLALQGELMGPGIQGNREDLIQPKFYLFDVWDIDEQRYWSPSERHDFAQEWDINEAPLIKYEVAGNLDLKTCLNMADCASIKNPVAEGVVFKSWDGQTSFKAINNNYLLKEAA